MPERSETFHSILLCADRSSEAQVALRKASILARYLDADIELFACDADHAWALSRATQDAAARTALAACLAESRRYLAALRGSIAASDLRIFTRAACAASFAEGVAERVREGGHDLVIKNFADGIDPGRGAATASDMALAQACRVPLLLTRSRAWRPEPRIWAALDLHRIEADVGREVVAAARAMARQCKGTFGLVYSRVRPASAAAAVPALGVARAAADVGVAAGDVHVLEGDPREALTGLLRKGGVDLLVIAQARDAAQGRREASLTERLLAIDGCDVMIVPRGEGGSVGAATVGIAALGEDAPHRER